MVSIFEPGPFSHPLAPVPTPPPATHRVAATTPWYPFFRSLVIIWCGAPTPESFRIYTHGRGDLWAGPGSTALQLYGCIKNQLMTIILKLKQFCAPPTCVKFNDFEDIYGNRPRPRRPGFYLSLLLGFCSSFAIIEYIAYPSPAPLPLPRTVVSFLGHGRPAPATALEDGTFPVIR